MSTYTLTYRKERSQEICVETIENIGKDVNLYFNREYDEAIKLVKEIILLQGIKEDEEDRGTNVDRSYKQNNKRDVAKYGCNNRILFAGQRGCGKTSVMRSLAEYLSKHKITINYDGDKDDIKVRCCCLPMVDPSHFDNNNNILLTVITSMFSVAKGYMKEFGDKNDTADREDLLRQFEKVFKSLDSIKSEITSYTLESLNRKSDAEDLRKKMNNLVAKYLKYIVGDKESRLVLLIDDIDMSVSYAPEMLEQLRKYLELDNLIILMSANLGQLSNEMREKYSSAFQYTLKDSNQALSIDVEDLATKYLLKLFPTSRRITIERHVSQLLETDLEGVIKTSATDKNKPKGNFQNVILSLIWSKTRLLFIPKDSENTLHPIIPTNLRDLAQFLDMLTTLERVEPGENNLFKNNDEYNKCNKNIQLFKRYVMHTWIPNHLAIEEELVFKNIPTDITEINKHLINSINVIGTMHKTRLMSREVSLDMIERNAENVNIDRDIYTMVSPNDPKFVKANKISDIFNQPSNYSYGDLLLMIDKYETYFESEEDRRLTDAIKIYYSILLFETMFFKSEKVRYSKLEFENLDEDEKVLPIQKLLGGTVYYPNYFEIITSKHFSQKGPSFDAKRAFYHKVELSKNNDKYIVGGNYPLFSVLYYGDIRPDRYDTKHIYDTTFENDADVDGKKYVTFDILSIFSNMLNPWHTIDRVGNAIPVKTRSKVGQKLSIEHYKDDDFTEWLDTCKINESDKIIPNSILPFYAVDVMLQYLKQSKDTDVINGSPVIKDSDNLNMIIAETVPMFYKINDLEETTVLCQDSTGLKVSGLDKAKKDTKKQSQKNDAICNENDTASKPFPEQASDKIKVAFSGNDLDELNANLIMLAEAKKCFVQCSLKCEANVKSVTDMYRNHVIALIMRDYKGVKREKKTLIKELHGYTTVSEIYAHLVDVLWVDAIREKGVRKKIQETVHKPEFVAKYYNLLWKNTKVLLENITVKKETPINIYENICNKAGKTFISEKFSLNNDIS